ncbi:MAG: hypothetical protein H6710_00475 [Myxococcales bacterium]|nr:hypothetical protein [Myxococcales bacterium]
MPAAVDTLLKPVSRAILRAHSGAVRAAAFSPDGETIASAADDGAVILWRWRRGEAERLAGHGGPVHSVMFSGTARGCSARRPTRP